jgi:hypothetical protein
MVKRMASKTIPATWRRKPIMTNWISPNEAMMTPITMKETFPRVFMFGGERPMTQDVIRTATGVVAFGQVSACSAYTAGLGDFDHTLSI